jgi:hypothetical protein
MASSRRQKGLDGVLTTLNVSIQALDIAKEACGIPPAQIALGSASVLLTMIRVCFPLLCEDPADSRIYRTRWQTIKIMSSLDRLAGKYAKRSTRD